MITVAAKGQLLEVVAAPRPVGRFAHLLDGRQQESDQHRDDGNDDQQLDERERPPTAERLIPHGRTPRYENGKEDAYPITLTAGGLVSSEFRVFVGAID